MFKIHKSYIPIYKGGTKAHENNKIYTHIDKTILCTDLSSFRTVKKEFSSTVSFLTCSQGNITVGFIDGSISYNNMSYKLHKSRITFIHVYNNLFLTCSSDKTAKTSVDGQIINTVYCKNIAVNGLIVNDIIFIVDVEGNVYKREGNNTLRFRGIHQKPYKMMHLNGRLYSFGNDNVIVYFTDSGATADVFLDEKKNERKVGGVFYKIYDIPQEDVVFVNNQFYFITENKIVIYDLEMKKTREHLISLNEPEETTILLKNINFTTQFIVTTTEDEILFLDDKYAIENTIIGNNDEITDMAKVDDKLFICTNSGRLRCMNINNDEGGIYCCKGDLIEGHTEAIMSIAMHNKRLVTSSKDSKAIVWDLENKKKTFLETHLESVNSCDISRDIIVTVGTDKTLQIFTNTPKPKHIFTKVIHSKEINAVKIHEDKKIIATASHDKTVKIFSFHGEEIKSLHLHKRGVWTLDFGKEILVTGSGDETIRIWTLSDYECIRILEGHTSSVIKVKMYDFDKKLISCDNGGIMRLWDIRKGKMLFVVDNIVEKNWSILTDDFIYTASAEGTINTLIDETEKIINMANEEEKTKKKRIFDLNKYKRENDYFKALKIAYEFDDLREVFNLIENCLLNEIELADLFPIFENDRTKLLKILKENLKIFKYNGITQPLMNEMLARKYFTVNNKKEFVKIMNKIFKNAEDLAIGLHSLELLFKEILIDELN